MSWSVSELKEYFDKIGIGEEKYGFYEEKDDAVCIEKKDNEWHVYYSERGKKYTLGWGKKESEALGILELFVRDYSLKGL